MNAFGIYAQNGMPSYECLLLNCNCTTREDALQELLKSSAAPEFRRYVIVLFVEGNKTDYVTHAEIEAFALGRGSHK